VTRRHPSSAAAASRVSHLRRTSIHHPSGDSSHSQLRPSLPALLAGVSVAVRVERSDGQGRAAVSGLPLATPLAQRHTTATHARAQSNDTRDVTLHCTHRAQPMSSDEATRQQKGKSHSALQIQRICSHSDIQHMCCIIHSYTNVQCDCQKVRPRTEPRRWKKKREFCMDFCCRCDCFCVLRCDASRTQAGQAVLEQWGGVGVMCGGSGE